MFGLIKKYRFSFILFFSIILAVILHFTGVFFKLVVWLGTLGYPSAFLSGLLFSTSFAGVPAALFFVNLGEQLNLWLVVIIGGLGAMLGDLIVYWFIKDGLLSEIKSLLIYIVPAKRLQTMENFTKKRMFVWGIPFLASFLIASPLPDELGVSLFGLINFKPKYLSLLTFILNAIGIFALVFIGHTVSN